MFKSIIVSFLSMFLHEVLAEKVGAKLFKGHATILSVTETTAVTEINIADGYRYKVTVEHVKEGDKFESEKTV